MAATTHAPAATTQDVNQLLNDLWSNLGMARPTGGASVAPQSLSSKAPTPATSPAAVVSPATPAIKANAEAKTASSPPASVSSFFPRAPKTLKDAGVSSDEVGRTILKLLAARGAHTGRKIAAHIRLMFHIVDDVLRDLRKEQFIVLKGEAIAGDYTYVSTEKGLSYAKEFSRDCTYYGSTPITLAQYVAAMKCQSISDQKIRADDLQKAFHDLQLDESLLRTLGPAMNSGRGMFLFGQPGNGKTSVAERVSRAFGEAIWIPRALGIDGQIIRVFDPSIHEEVGKDDPQLQRLDSIDIDQRWIRIRRPTVVAGGELTMAELEVTQDENSGICEAPLQLKSNGGVLLIDDFGRQRMPVDELLNRWIIPLEKRYDLLNLPSGKKVQVPFDQLVIFSTNLEPKDLVDDAFLRRIPYKIEVPDPTPAQFHHIFEIMCRKLVIDYDRELVDYLIQSHYVAKNRPMRACHPRDLLMQIKNLCVFEDRPAVITKESIEFAVGCYFSVLG